MSWYVVVFVHELRRLYDRHNRHARSRPINPVPQRQLDGLCTALPNTECQRRLPTAPKSQFTAQSSSETDSVASGGRSPETPVLDGGYRSGGVRMCQNRSVFRQLPNGLCDDPIDPVPPGSVGSLGFVGSVAGGTVGADPSTVNISESPATGSSVT